MTIFRRVCSAVVKKWVGGFPQTGVDDAAVPIRSACHGDLDVERPGSFDCVVLSPA